MNLYNTHVQSQDTWQYMGTWPRSCKMKKVFAKNQCRDAFINMVKKTPFRIPFPAIHVQSHMARALQRLLAQASLVWLTMTSPNNDHLPSSTYLTTSSIYDISMADFWSPIYVLQCLVLVWILPCKMSSSCLNSKHHWTFVKTIFLLSQSWFIILSLDYFQCIFSRLTSKLHEMLFFFQIHSQTQTIPGSDSQSFQVKQWHCDIILHSTHLFTEIATCWSKCQMFSVEMLMQVPIHLCSLCRLQCWRWRRRCRGTGMLADGAGRSAGRRACATVHGDSSALWFSSRHRRGSEPFFGAEKRTAGTTPPDSDGWNSW